MSIRKSHISILGASYRPTLTGDKKKKPETVLINLFGLNNTEVPMVLIQDKTYKTELLTCLLGNHASYNIHTLSMAWFVFVIAPEDISCP